MGAEVAVVGLVAVLALATFNTKLVDYLVEPLKKKFPGMDFFWVQYVSLATGIAIGMFSGLNLFVEIVPDMTPVVGQILTSAALGAGSSLIHDWLDTK
jgi:hypothetical protein